MKIFPIWHQQYNNYNHLRFCGQWIKLPPMSAQEIEDTYKKLYPEYSQEDLFVADENGNIPLHRESRDDRVKKICDMLKDNPEKLKRMLLWKNNHQDIPAHYASAPKLKILCDALKDDKEALETMLLSKNQAGRIPIANFITKGLLKIAFDALEDNPDAIKRILAHISDIDNSPLLSCLREDDILMLANKYVELGETDLLKKQLLIGYHDPKDPNKLVEGNTPLHDMDAIGLKRILDIFRGDETTLAKLLLAKNAFNEMPLYTQKGERVRIIINSVKNYPSILCKMLNNVSKDGFSTIYMANADKTNIIIESLKDKPEILIPAILIKSEKNQYDNCLYGAGPQKIKIIFNYLQDYPAVMVKLLSERNANNKITSELADIEELPIILDTIYDLATNYKQNKIPYTTALRLLNENVAVAERYDKYTGSNFAKKFKQAFCIDVDEIKHPSGLIENLNE